MSATETRKLIEEILNAEIGEHSAVDVPATDRPYKLFKSLDGDGKGKCGCAGGAGEGVDGMRKDEVLPAPPPSPAGEMPPEGQMVAETIEIPASPDNVTYSDLIRIAMDYGFSEDESTAIAQLLRKDFGDPTDPDTVYVPEGSTPEGMVGAAAVQGGLAIPEGMPVEKGLKFTGSNRWSKLWRRFMGTDKPLTAEARLRGEVMALKTAQAKNRADFMEIIRLQNQLIARVAGVPQEELDEMMAGTPVAAAPAVPVPEVAAPAKAVAKRSAEEILAQLKELLMGDQPAALAAVTEPTEMDPAVLDVDPDLGSERVIDPATAPVIGDEPVPAGVPELKLVPASRKAMESGAPRQRPELKGKVMSTFLGGYIPLEDRRVAGWKRGIELP